ncbi:MAG TPA: hypothetical protein VNO70_22635 [Blastocatellia bacterium]|nr:hypothetical protein [Blastocatellia bacterium]
MKLSEYKNRIGSAVLTLAMLVGFGVAAGVTAQAQYRDYGYGRYDDRVRWSKDRTRQYAALLGYIQGFREADEARNNGYRVDYDEMPNYRHGTGGWRAWMGYESDFRSSYRRGYETGFKDGYNRRPRRYTRSDVERVLGDDLDNVYGRGYGDRWERRGRGGWRDRNDRDDDYYPGRGRYDREQLYRIAQQNGYREGFQEGREDRSRRRGYECENESAYRDGLRGYRSEYGDRRIYQAAYREGFRRGYEEGYRGQYGNRGRSRWPF